MFGLEILDVLIGLFFVYLVLSLICTGINEYIAALTNKRGKELQRGIEQLLQDSGADDLVKQRVMNHPLIDALRQKRGSTVREPSYIPARTFAMALLDAAGKQPDAGGRIKTGELPATRDLNGVLEVLRRDSTGDLVQFITDPQTYSQLNLPADVKTRITEQLVGARTEYQKLQDSVEVWFNNSMDRVSGAYKRHTQAMLLLIGLVVAVATNADTIQIWRTLSANDALAARFADQAAASMPRVAQWIVRDSLQRANAAADAPAGEATQAVSPDSGTVAPDSGTDAPVVGVPLPTGMRVDSGATADTTQSSEKDTTRLPGQTSNDTVGGAQNDTAAIRVDSLAAAKALYDSASSLLRSMELKLGWTTQEWKNLGIRRERLPARERPTLTRWLLGAPDAPTGKKVWQTEWRPWQWRWNAVLPKLIGLVLTALALSMGAPFWFDTLNRFINIRGAGRAPDEKAKSPEAPGKRLAEQPTR